MYRRTDYLKLESSAKLKILTDISEIRNKRNIDLKFVKKIDVFRYKGFLKWNVFITTIYFAKLHALWVWL